MAKVQQLVTARLVNGASFAEAVGVRNMVKGWVAEATEGGFMCDFLAAELANAEAAVVAAFDAVRRAEAVA